jgi:hypothetical protein
MNEQKSEIEEFKDKMQEDNMKSIGEQLTGGFAEAYKKIESIEKQVKELRLNHELLRAEFLADKSMDGNSFISSLSAIKIAMELGQKSVIDSIMSEMEKQIVKMGGVFGSDIQQISDFLGNMKDFESIPKERLLKKLREIHKL